MRPGIAVLAALALLGLVAALVVGRGAFGPVESSNIALVGGCSATPDGGVGTRVKLTAVTTDKVDFLVRVDVVDTADGETVATWTRTQTVDSDGNPASYLIDVAVPPFGDRPDEIRCAASVEH